MTTSRTSPALFAAFRRLLSPVVRLMLARGIGLQTAVELLKRVFVEVAERDFSLDGKAATDSRISLLTGVHRKDVRRLRSSPQEDEVFPEKISLGAQVVATWTTVSPWLDASGQPRPLPRLASVGGDISFEALVASVSRDIRPRSVLDEWLRLGVVAINGKDEVELREDAFIPSQGEEEKLVYYGHNLGDHAAAATENVLGGGKPWFERSVHHNGLSKQQVEAIRAKASVLGMELLQELHLQASQQIETNEPDDQRFTCGVYFYGANQDSNQSE